MKDTRNGTDICALNFTVRMKNEQQESLEGNQAYTSEGSHVTVNARRKAKLSLVPNGHPNAASGS
jgi:hypothetical protein